MSTPRALEGRRQFSWFTPQKAFPTEYERLTVGLQSSPESWLHVDWPVRFEDGRAPFVKSSTALRCADWEGFRDPAALMQREHVADSRQQGQALAALTEESLHQELLHRIHPVWRDEVLGTYYAAWPFVEYGQFLALCYAVREALAGALTFGLTFQASDKLQHNQEIVHYLCALRVALPGFSDDGARDAWMKSPALVSLRETLERIMALPDWAEILVAIQLVLEPLAGDLFKTELLAKHAALHGDPVTSVMVAATGANSRRHRQFAAEFVRFAAADPDHGSTNRDIIRSWMDRWTPQSEQAAEALRPVFELRGLTVEPFEDCFQRIRSRHRKLVAELSLSPGRPA